jgi:amidase
MSAKTTDQLIFTPATELAALLRKRAVSAAEVVEAFIARYLAVNDVLNAIVMNSFARARVEAKALDQRSRRGDFAGPLHGVPMTIKDTIDTEGVISTAGTVGRQQYVPREDATAVARARRAGAILLGKTNTPEFTLGGVGLNTASNLLYGATHNPYDPARSAFGSSGGSGAAVAAGLCTFDIGTDFAGSIRLPAHNNGVAGIRPTSGRVPRTGHVIGYGGVYDLWQQLGPLCRRVADLSLITPIISGPDFRDAGCPPVPWRDPLRVELATLRVAWVADNGGTADETTDEDTRSTLRTAARWLEGVVSRITETAPREQLIEIGKLNDTLRSGDAFAFLQRLSDKWGTHNISPLRKRWMEDTKPISSAAMIDAWQRHDALKTQLRLWMRDFDVFMCPVAPTPAKLIDQRLKESEGVSGPVWPYTDVFSSAGWPVVVVRAGGSADGKLPIGVQIAAAPWREDVALAVAGYIESRSGGWQRPPL